MKAFRDLTQDKFQVTLSVDKVVALFGRHDYTMKIKLSLKQGGTYTNIPADPTNRQKNKLIRFFKQVKADGGMVDSTYRRMYTTGSGSSKFYGLPQIHKIYLALRPILSSRGTVTYGVAKECARILRPFVVLC